MLSTTKSTSSTPLTSKSLIVGSNTTPPHSAKKQKIEPACHVHAPLHPSLTPIIASKSPQRLETVNRRKNAKPSAKEQPVHNNNNAGSRIPSNISASSLKTNSSNIEFQPQSLFRPYDPLPPPATSDIHRYIISTRLLQNTTIVRALVDTNLGRAELVDRDVEYLRVFLPEETSRRSTTRVEADIILDENNAVILYPLREIGQSTAQDPDAGLNELVTILGRVGPRYKAVWLILEEYSWARLAPSVTKSDRSIPRESFAKEDGKDRPTIESTTIKDNYQEGRTESTSDIKPDTAINGVVRLDPFAGPVIVQLNKLMAWIHTTHDQESWWARQSQHTPLNYHNSCHLQSALQDPFLSAFTGIGELKFQTRVLFASDERCTAWMSRAIGDGIATTIERSARAGVRREEDGWQDREEWVWRDWLNERDSTLILSLCSLKEFMGMDHKQRVKTVGKFIDHKVLAIFDKIITSPLN
ncbi:hypothetical protein BGX27_001007 [Mortierella sp. AM989]|nr:hypothetical protein BGX27_001007 [Mortierella sp. AM989]